MSRGNFSNQLDVANPSAGSMSRKKTDPEATREAPIVHEDPKIESDRAMVGKTTREEDLAIEAERGLDLGVRFLYDFLHKGSRDS